MFLLRNESMISYDDPVDVKACNFLPKSKSYLEELNEVDKQRITDLELIIIEQKTFFNW